MNENYNLSLDTQKFIENIDKNIQSKLLKEYQKRLNNSKMKHLIKYVKICGAWHSITKTGNIFKAPNMCYCFGKYINYRYNNKEMCRNSELIKNDEQKNEN